MGRIVTGIGRIKGELMPLQLTRALLISAVLSLLLSACAVSPFNKVGLEQTDRTVSYTQAVQNPDAVRDRQVLFGGSIISTHNFADHTEIILLAYPVDNTDRPNTSAAPLGRFIVVHPGYLEGAQYAPGRLLSVRGTLRGVRVLPLEQNQYTHPLLNAHELYLWPGDDTPPQGYFPPWLHIGIGVVL